MSNAERWKEQNRQRRCTMLGHINVTRLMAAIIFAWDCTPRKLARRNCLPVTVSTLIKRPTSVSLAKRIDATWNLRTISHDNCPWVAPLSACKNEKASLWQIWRSFPLVTFLQQAESNLAISRMWSQDDSKPDRAQVGNSANIACWLEWRSRWITKDEKMCCEVKAQERHPDYCSVRRTHEPRLGVHF